MELNKKFFLALVLIIVGVASRFIFLIDGVSAVPNFSAVGAIALLGATYFKGVSKWMIPIALLWISDLVLNNVVYAEYYDSFQFIGSTWVYGAFLLTGIVAYFIMRKASWFRLGVAGLTASIIFFVVTNFGVWMTSGMYTLDTSGLVTCFTLAIPFFINTLLGNLFYSFLLFGIYEFTAARNKKIQPVLGDTMIA